MHMMQIVWLVAMVVFIVAEAATASIVSIWFCAGSLVALLLSFALPEAIILQVGAFLLVSLLTLVAVRPAARRLIGNRRVATNADANIGKMAQVVSAIAPGQNGRVKLEGLEWAAKCDCELPVGAWCRVEAIEGVKLVVSPTAQPAGGC